MKPRYGIRHTPPDNHSLRVPNPSNNHRPDLIPHPMVFDRFCLFDKNMAVQNITSQRSRRNGVGYPDDTATHSRPLSCVIRLALWERMTKNNVNNFKLRPLLPFVLVRLLHIPAFSQNPCVCLV
jgi:hypothetical protein